jgi:hypothetical protein
MRLMLEPDLAALGPGDLVDLLVRLHNDGDDVCTPVLDVHGVDPDDVLLPVEVVAVAPGEVMTAIVRLRIPPDAAPGDRRISVAATDAHGLQVTVASSAVLRVGRRPDVAIEVDPAATRGRRGAKARTVLRNRSDRRLRIELQGGGDGVDVRFRPRSVVLDPGETLQVPTRIRRTRRSWFDEIRHGAVVRAVGIGVPATTTITYLQRPAIPRAGIRAVAALAALAVWAAASLSVFQWINAEDPVAESSGVVVAAPPGPGRTSASTLGVSAEDPAVALPIVIQGVVEGPRDPSGTVVTAERLSFGDEGTTSGPTKLVALSGVKLPRGSVLDRVQVTTDERGRFRIASGLVTDSFYRVTMARAGFEVASFIVSTSDADREVALGVMLQPATGALSGRVIDRSGVPLGGAVVSVSDGTATYTAVTDSEGDAAGTWSLEGLATPASYQVVVTRLGFASETLIVDLDGGQVLAGVDATLTADRGTIRGAISAVNPATNQEEGVGGIDITLAGAEARVTKSLTSPAGLRGNFEFPALPFGTYELTFTADGWLTQVATVTVDRGDVVLSVDDLVRSTGVVQGYVHQQVFADAGACRYPRPNQIPDLLTVLPCGGVTVSLVSDDGDTFATASASLGSIDEGLFKIEGVPAGEYSLRFAQAGYQTRVERVVVRAGQVLEIRAGDDLSVAVKDDPIVLQVTSPVANCIGLAQIILLDGRDGTPVPGELSGAITVPNIQCAGNGPDVQRIGTTSGYLITRMPLGVPTVRVEVPGFSVAETNLAVNSLDVAVATVRITPLPRDVTGSFRATAGGADLTGASRAGLTAQLLDSAGAAISGRSVVFDADTLDPDDGSLTGAFTLPSVAIADGYRVRVSGPGITTATTAVFDLIGGETAFDVGELVERARTVVSGRVFGFDVTTLSLTPLEGAAVRVPDAANPVAAGEFALSGVSSGLRTVTTNAQGSFAVEVDSGVFAAGGFGAILVDAAGYGERTISGELIGVEQSLRPSGESFLLLYEDLADPSPPVRTVTQRAVSGGIATLTTSVAHGFAVDDVVVVAGVDGRFDGVRTITAVQTSTFSFVVGGSDLVAVASSGTARLATGFGLDPTARDVAISLSLAGASGASRDVTVRLVDGSIAGRTLDDATATATLTVGSETTVTFEDVAVGTYTLEVVPTSGDGQVVLATATVTSGGGTVAGDRADGFTLAVPPDVAGDGAVALTATAQALTRVGFAVTDAQVTFDAASEPELGAAPVSGATIVLAASGEQIASETTGMDGTASVVLDSGVTYDVTVTASGFVPIVTTLTVGAPLTQTVDYEFPAAGLLRIFGTTTANVESIRFTYDDGGSNSVVLLTPGPGAPGEKDFSQDGLPADTLITVEFFDVADPSTGDPTPLVTRWVQNVALGTPQGNVSVQLDQDADPSDLGDLKVTVEVAEHESATAEWVRITLTEVVPSDFYSLTEDGTKTVWVATGTATGDVRTIEHTFEGLPTAASSSSLPEDRLQVDVELVTADGSDTPFTGATYEPVLDGPWTPVAGGSSTLVRAEAQDVTGDSIVDIPTLRFNTTPGTPAAPDLTVLAQQESDSSPDQQRIGVAWSAPSNTGGVSSPDPSYIVSYREGSSDDFTSLPETDAGALTAEISGLKAGTAYEVKVAAVNPVGTGPASGVAGATTADVPDAPTGVSASTDGGRVTVTWDAPVDEAGTPVTEYTVTSDPETTTCTTSTTSCTFASGFAASTGYTFTVFATNAVGSGQPSDPSGSVPPITTVAEIDPADGSSFATFTPLGGLGTVDGEADGGVYFAFDGTDDALDLGTTLLPTNTSYTIIAWVWLDSAADGPNNILSTEPAPFWWNGGTLQAGVGGSYSVVSEASFPKGAWQHVAVTFRDGGGAKEGVMTLYRNGVSVDSASALPDRFVAGQAYLGAHVKKAEDPGDPTSFWNGRIGEVEVYVGELTASGVEAIFDVTKSRYGVS